MLMLMLMLWQALRLLMLMLRRPSVCLSHTTAANDWSSKYKQLGNKSLSLTDWVSRKISSFEEQSSIDMLLFKRTS